MPDGISNLSWDRPNGVSSLRQTESNENGRHVTMSRSSAVWSIFVRAFCIPIARIIYIVRSPDVYISCDETILVRFENKYKRPYTMVYGIRIHTKMQDDKHRKIRFADVSVRIKLLFRIMLMKFIFSVNFPI